MLPLAVMCVVAGSVVFSHRASAAHAAAVENRVADLRELVALRAALNDQQAAEEFEVRFAEVGVTRGEATGFIGFDWMDTVPAARLRASHAVAILGLRSPVSDATLRSVYAAIDDGTLSPKEAAQRLAELAGSAVRAVTRWMDEVAVVGSYTPLVAALNSLRATMTLADTRDPQVIDLSAIWFPAPGATPEATAAVVSRFNAESAGRATAVAELVRLNVPSVRLALDQIDADPNSQVFDAAVRSALLGEPLNAVGAPVDTVRAAAAFNAYRGLDILRDALVATSLTAVSDDARELHTSEQSGFVRWTLGSAAVTLATIGIALLLARSISRPLKDLAKYAHAVNDGQLDAEPPSSRRHGPSETRVVFRTFGDLVANLQLLDSKANALAHCDFDDPALQIPLPGRLGQSLESSVALLSGSIVERDQLQSHLAHQATHDSLTGILNRAAAISGIKAAMHRGARSGATTAVLYVDLNGFKSVNDHHGHEVGDEVLRQVGERMRLELRAGDFVARLGGDEFVVVVEGVDGVADATILAKRILDSVARPIEVNSAHITIGAAIGIALALDGPEEPLRLLARAEAAMYRAKRHENSPIEIFGADLQRQMLEREDIETALTVALHPENGELRLHYQPVLDAVSGALVGTEALIRWDRPGHGLLSPDAFIPIAEATPLIVEVDRWVLRAATRQLVAWSTVPELADVPVAVNISGRHLLSGQLPAHIRDALGETGIDPRRLSIEITETVLLDDLVAAALQLDAVRALGIKVAVDDFGTGYTSLAHLQLLPLDTIKIDRSFVSQLNARRGSSLVRMVTDLGHAIDLTIVAEGVETEEELHVLQEIGADQLQGYLLSRPLEPAALSEWAAERTMAMSV